VGRSLTTDEVAVWTLGLRGLLERWRCAEEDDPMVETSSTRADCSLLIDGLRESQPDLRCPGTDGWTPVGASLHADEGATDRTLAATLRASLGG